MAGIYIHVPFCVRKCHYCDFYSVASLDSRTSYLDALKQETLKRAYLFREEVVDTIYWGGGTPSLLTPLEISDIMALIRENYCVASDPEITIECNPGDYEHIGIEALVKEGFNRFSIGAQSFDDTILAFLGRRHSVSDTVALVSSLKSLGVPNYSLDLIYGVPGTTLEMLQQDLDSLLSYTPTHISAYELTYEEGTPLYRSLERGDVAPLDEELLLKMSYLVRRHLHEAGYEHYEVSNYALPSYRSSHNSSYWKEKSYIGLGPAAHSYLPPWRSSNPSDLSRYIEGFKEKNENSVEGCQYEYLTPSLRYEEYLLTRLRTSEGISVQEVDECFGLSVATTLAERLALQVQAGMMRKVSERWVLTSQGLDLLDTILAGLL